MTKKITRAVIMKVDDWETLYIDGVAVDSGHKLGEGNVGMYMLKMSEKYDIKSGDLTCKYIEEGQDYEDVKSTGNFPDTLTELKEDYFTNKN